MPTTDYTRLTRSRSRGFFAVAVMSRCSLWLGADHLLLVDFNGYTESYKRFYFRDIQALIMQRSEAFTLTYVALGIPFVVLMVSALATADTGGKVVLFSLAGILTVLGVIHILRGKTCRCYLRTAVQVEQLVPLTRVRGAQKAFARLRPLIAAAQGGELSPEQIAEQMREHALGSEPLAPAAPDAVPPVITTEIPVAPPLP